MKTNTIDLKAINDLLGCKFYIPSYQRGYRWTEQQMKELLNDLWEFKQEKPKDDSSKLAEFYCLQPIVVMERNNRDLEEIKEGEWVVIDGQQRLTSLLILLSCVSDVMKILRKEPYVINYATRQDSGAFLQNIDLTMINNNIDYNHICRAKKVAEEWLRNKDGSDVVNFVSDILTKPTSEEGKGRNVRVIWYEIKDTEVNPKEVFQRLNIGKIPLTNSELIKALFLSNKENNAHLEVFNLRRDEIAQEWDRMEVAFQNDKFWYFLNEKVDTTKATRIDFIFDLITKKSLEQKKNEQYNHYSFLMFQELYQNANGVSDFWKEKKIYNLREAWNEVRLYFQVLQEWYNDEEFYHYIGFLVCCNYQIDKIYGLYKNSTGKENFREMLRTEIKKCLPEEPLKELNYYESWGIKHVLLLFNIETTIGQYKKLKSEYGGKINSMYINRFPFSLYKIEKWDIEHVHSQTDKEIGNKKVQTEWLRYALKESIEDSLRTEIEHFIKHIDSNTKDVFKRIEEKVEKAIGDTVDLKSKDSIGNLTLLDAGTNRAYKNAMFATKRNIIVDKDKEGTFIPVCTKNLFLKYYTSIPQKGNKWANDDMDAYVNAMQDTLEYYFPKPIKDLTDAE